MSAVPVTREASLDGVEGKLVFDYVVRLGRDKFFGWPAAVIEGAVVVDLRSFIVDRTEEKLSLGFFADKLRESGVAEDVIAAAAASEPPGFAIIRKGGA